MKKVFLTLLAGLTVSAQVMAVSVADVCGQFTGDLNIGGSPYPNKTVYLLPGTVDNAVTFVLPDFTYNAGNLGNIVLPNIQMDANGQLTLENSTLYIKAIDERATITVLNGLEDGGTVYNSIVSHTSAQVLLQIAAPSLPEPILVLFAGQAVMNKNYFMLNGGFEGAWTDYEPEGWHSFWTATGIMVDFIKGNDQFVQSSVTRPGSAGQNSALLSSKFALSAKANGTCTNGQLSAGSSTAADPSNHSFSDPTNTGFNTPLNGQPDSIVFWAKYVPADKNPANEVNRARMHTVLTTNARYQDPEAGNDYSAVKIAEAEINYAATASLGWQRLSVPFVYHLQGQEPAYILATFTTNMTPGGGSSYSTGTSFSKVNVLDTLYLDDVELIYNKTLNSFKRDGETLSFANHVASVADNYCDDCSEYAAQSNGRTAKSFVAFDAIHKCIYVYVIADNYAQTGSYSLYRVEFADSNVAELNPVEGVEQVQRSSRLDTRKVLRDGKLYILRGDAVYTINGVRVQ